MDIKERVIKSAANTFNIAFENISITDTKDDIESWDSLGHLQLIMGLEVEFNIKLKTREITEIACISDCIKIVEKLSKL